MNTTIFCLWNIMQKLIVVIDMDINNNNKYNNICKGVFQITSDCTIIDLYVVEN